MLRTVERSSALESGVVSLVGDASGSLNGLVLVLVPVMRTVGRLKFGFISREG